MKLLIPHLRPWVLPQDIEAVSRTLSEKSVSSGHNAAKLCDTIKSYSGFKHCALYASGTLALRAALLSLPLPVGSGIGVPAFTCEGVMNGVMGAGHNPYVLDCDDSGLMKAEETLRAFREGHISAAIAVHQYGLVNRAIEPLASVMPIMEDCSHVHPKAHLRGSSAAFGSLEGTKLIGAGEGGYLLLDHQREEKDPAFIANLGMGNRLSDVVAVLAIRQLERLENNIEKREAIADHYKRRVPGVKVVEGERAAWLRFLVRMDSLQSVNSLINEGQREGITLRRAIMPHPLHKYFSKFTDSCPNADKLWKTLVSIPLYPDLTESEIVHTARFLSAQLGNGERQE